MIPMDLDDTDSAMQRALRMPEILANIFEWISLDIDFYGEGLSCIHETKTENGLCMVSSEGALARCALVNRLWFHEAVRILWRKPGITWHVKTLSELFSKIEEARREIYAAWVEEGPEETMDPDDPNMDVLTGVAFPRLRELELNMNAIWNGTCVAKLRAENLKHLVLDPSFDFYPDTYRVNRKQLDEILDQVAELFPNLESYEFVDRCLGYPGVIERFNKRLPRLDWFTADSVLTEHVDGEED